VTAPNRPAYARGVTEVLSRSGRNGFVREAGLVAAAIVAYFGIRNRTVGSPEEAFVNADRIVGFERWANIAWEDSVQAWIVGSDFLVMLTNWVYIWGHWPVILGTAVLLYRYRRDSYYLLRNALFVSGAIGFFFFAVLPVAPPRLLDLGLADTVTDQSNTYRALQPPGLTNQYAAFPSLHVGWNILVGIVLVMTTAHLAVRVFAVASPLAMGFAVVATANHFVVDVAAGVLVVLVGLAVALAIERPRAVAATLGPSGSAARLGSSRRAQSVRRGAPRGEPTGCARRGPALRRGPR
jgi:PAP2 superfamily